MKLDNGRVEGGGYAGFRDWVMSLDREELLDAMAFTFKPNTNISKGSTATLRSVSSTSTQVESHEYELLLSMIRLQPPPPTPVHPLATGYESRSQKGARLDFFYKEEEHLRWTKPRLFQWSEKEEQLYGSGRAIRGRLRNRSRTKHNNSNGGAGTHTRRFDVFARKKVAPWGDIYSLGCTREQNDADFSLIKGTRLGRRRIDGKYHATACFVSSGERDEADEHTSGRSRDRGKGPTAASIVKLLLIASRGQLFHQHAKSFDSKRSPTLSDVDIPYCAPWLRPTERWFSLGMYLASRFRIALWDAYQKNQSNNRRRRQQQATVNPGRIIRLGGNWYGYEETILRDALVKAIRRTLKMIMKEEQKSSRLNYLRDGTLWSMLESNRVVHGHTFLSQINIRNPRAEGNWKNAAREWSLIRIVDIDSPFHNRFKCLVIDQLEEELVAQTERAIFEEVESEHKKGRQQDVADTLPSTKKRNKTKRKKKKKRQGAQNGRISDTNPGNPLLRDRIDKGHNLITSASDLSSVGGDDEINTTSPSPRLDFPTNSTPAHERNRNIIFALSVLEEVTERVFEQVGLTAVPEPENSDVDNAENTGNQLHFPNILLPKKTTDVDNGTFATDINRETPLGDHVSKNSPSGALQTCRSLDRDLPNHSDVNALSFYIRQNDAFSSNLYSPFLRDGDFGLHSLDYVGEEMDHWPFVNRYQSRDRSILSNFFQSQNEKVDDKEDADDEERLMAASTAASIASSTYKDTTYVAGTEEEIFVPENIVEEDSLVPTDMSGIGETDDSCSMQSNTKGDDDCNSAVNTESDVKDTSLDVKEVCNEVTGVAISNDGDNSSGTTSDCRSQTLQAPITPPPTLSPILVSLGDLKKMKDDPSFSIKRFPSLDFETTKPMSGPGSLPPTSPSAPKGLVGSWSREDLRIESFRDDHNIRNDWRDRIKCQRGFEVPTYKSSAFKTVTKPVNSGSDDTGSLDHRMHFIDSARQKRDRQKDSCAQSEIAVDAHHGEHQEWYKEVENQSLTRDETTTIISGISHRGEAEELGDVQEQRNFFRDMCLTLGAEVATLKVMLATQQAASAAPVNYQDSSFGYAKMYGHESFGPNSAHHSFHGAINGARPGPMSDAGFHRYGDHESLISEDDIHDTVSRTRETRVDPLQRMASSQTIASQTVAESDVSVDFTSIKVPLSAGQVPGSMPVYDSFHCPGLQSRLTKDILQFLHETKTKMKNLDGRRKLAVQRFSRLVKNVWPRAQVKLYGSYISGLCLPTSDLDLVVCLPAVHKKDLALAPGVLEGRNAFNETSQKLLARELKGESWIDPRSMKVIEHTAIPVIKVSTKDTRARMIHLDISFDGPEHHGQEANRIVAQTLEELPLIRPLMLVLKQFLLHRGLLTTYTGGLSSYCLFLMLARYLQEQPPSNSDCGSLLMGFLDFYGNHFDPRAIGISVGGRQYFARANSHTAAAGYEPTAQPFWNGNRPPHKQRVVINDLPQNSNSNINNSNSNNNNSNNNNSNSNNPTNNSNDFRRRNSFSDAGSVDDTRRRGRPLFATPTGTGGSVAKVNHRYASRITASYPSATTTTNNNSNNSNNNYHNNFSGFERPSTFDPLFVEDPLSATNNVGRNAFRINQVQRAFSDAHRALIASLDWDIQSAEASGRYPLLKCLLGNQREDVLYRL